MNKRKEFAEWIKAQRYKTGMSLREASEKLGYKSRGTMTCVESGQMPLPIERIFDVADLYKVNIKEILEKLQECEPELYEKFIGLEQRFLAYFLKDYKPMERYQMEKKASLQMQNYQDIRTYRPYEKARHHIRPFSTTINTLCNIDAGLHPAPEYILSDILYSSSLSYCGWLFLF